MGKRSPLVPRNLAIRHLAAIAVAAVALEILFRALGPDLFFRSRAIAHIAHGTRPSFLQVSLAHLSLIVLALVLMIAVPRLWHGTRAAVCVAIGALAGLVIFNVVEARGYDHVVIEAGLALLLAGGRRAFPACAVAAGVATNVAEVRPSGLVIKWSKSCSIELRVIFSRIPPRTM